MTDNFICFWTRIERGVINDRSNEARPHYLCGNRKLRQFESCQWIDALYTDIYTNDYTPKHTLCTPWGQHYTHVFSDCAP